MKGKVVRLSKGDPKTAKFYDHMGSPVQIAQKWKNEGAERLHIIDLDAAFGTGYNTETIIDIAKTATLPIQVGGGIRKMEHIRKLLANKINYVILGALAFADPNSILQIQHEFGNDPIIVALDNDNGKIMVEGWKTPTEYSVAEAMNKFSKLNVDKFLITSIARDGTLSGPDIQTLTEACKHPNAKVLAAGGISTLDDLTALKKTGVEGAIIGKALYEGKFTLKEAIKTAEGD
jgi:phosphoribosylformimino-5-aminoimidazole carboxamide ribotide isomerase